MISEVCLKRTPNEYGTSHKDLTQSELNIYLLDWRLMRDIYGEAKRFIFDMKFSWLHHTREINVEYTSNLPKMRWFE